jgi:thiamine biosynthesis lipoprotein
LCLYRGPLTELSFFGYNKGMQTSSQPHPVERARPLLGTQVNIRIEGLAEGEAHKVIDQSFDAAATVHSLMSFHEPQSELSALNREASRKAVAVSQPTYDVLRYGLDIAAASQGGFDMAVAAQLVAWGFLPRPDGDQEPDPQASWRDIELLGENRVRFHRPLWIDLGGIAKGYAVDCAVEKAMSLGAVQCSVNAGGDLRVAGPRQERVLLRTDAPGDTVPVLDIENGSIASSSGRKHLKPFQGIQVGPHLHGAQRTPVGIDSFVSVVAERCITADALTKVVLACGAEAGPLLWARQAAAYLHSADGGWRVIGGGG